MYIEKVDDPRQLLRIFDPPLARHDNLIGFKLVYYTNTSTHIFITPKRHNTVCSADDLVGIPFETEEERDDWIRKCCIILGDEGYAVEVKSMPLMWFSPVQTPQSWKIASKRH